MMDELDCVVLAAGSSTRMERWKMTLPLGDCTVVERTVRTALEVCSRVILVGGYRGQELESLFRSWKRVEVVINPLFEQGMFSSVQQGSRFVTSDGFFVALGDMPGVEAETYRTLLRWREGSAALFAALSAAYAVIPKYRGKKGHPLLLSAAMREKVSGFDSGKTLRDVLAGVPAVIVPVEDRYILHDIDTPEDYRRTRGSLT